MTWGSPALLCSTGGVLVQWIKFEDIYCHLYLTMCNLHFLKTEVEQCVCAAF